MEQLQQAQLVCPACQALNRLPIARLADRAICGKCQTPLLGKPLEADDHSLTRVINKTTLPVVVDFWAPWCGPCKSFAPTFMSLAAELAGRLSFVKLDTQANQQAATNYQIRSIPTLVLFSGGSELARVSGALPKAQFLQWLEQHLPR